MSLVTTKAPRLHFGSGFPLEPVIEQLDQGGVANVIGDLRRNFVIRDRLAEA